MPGVPGRGCDACRKQKKKCIGGGTSCTRCLRLGLACSGPEKKRFLFKDQSDRYSQSAAERHQSLTPPTINGVGQAPFSDRTTWLGAKLVSRIGSHVPIQYQLLWNFGNFIADIPCRLGNSPALDSATNALVSMHTDVSVGRLNSSCDSIAKYVDALQMLRLELDDVNKASSSETLCAIMVLMIVQCLNNPCASQSASHPQGAARILLSKGFSKPKDSFEQKLLMTLRGPVVLESFMANNIKFTRDQWRTLVESELDGINNDTRWLTHLASLPVMMERYRNSDLYLQSALLSIETEGLLEECRSNVSALEGRLQAFEATRGSSVLDGCIHSYLLRTLAMTIMVGNLLIVALDIFAGPNAELLALSNHWIDKIIDLSRAGRIYRPLGSMSMVLALRTAWKCTENQETKASIRELVLEYEAECLGLRPEQSAVGLEASTARQTLLDCHIIIPDEATVTGLTRLALE